MTKEELATEKIEFGQAKRGVTFAAAFQDIAWTEMIITRYQNSSKPEHLTYLRFVELMLADMPATSQVLPQAASVGEEWERVSLQIEEESLVLMQEALAELRDLMQNLCHRMDTLESQQSQILMRLQG